MKGLLGLSLLILLLEIVVVFAQPFGPPLYIADPANMKCRYYFAGDQRHFNSRPDNYTINIGYTTDFKSESQACEFFRCVATNGTVKVDESRKPIEKDLCLCKEGSYWHNESGCIKVNVNKKEKQQGFFSRIFGGWKKRICAEI